MMISFYKIIKNIFKNKKLENNNKLENYYPTVYRLDQFNKCIEIEICKEELFEIIEDLKKENFGYKLKFANKKTMQKSIDRFVREELKYIYYYCNFKKQKFYNIKNTDRNISELVDHLLRIEKGIKFEKLIVGLLSLNPEYKSVQWLGKFNKSGDNGIDIKVVKHNGDYELIQCKYRDIFSKIIPFTTADTQFINGKIYNNNEDNNQKNITIITNSFFNSAAIQQILKYNGEQKTHYKLIGHNELWFMINSLFKELNFLPSGYPFFLKECNKCSNNIFIKATKKDLSEEYDYCINCANSLELAVIKKAGGSL